MAILDGFPGVCKGISFIPGSHVRAGSRGAGCPQGAAAWPGMGIYGDLIADKSLWATVFVTSHPGPSPEGTLAWGAFPLLLLTPLCLFALLLVAVTSAFFLAG